MKAVYILECFIFPLTMLTDFQTLIIPFSVKTDVRSTACHLVEDL